MLIRQVKKDEIFSIKVEGSPSTGYHWAVVVNEGVQLVSTQTIDPHQNVSYEDRPSDGKIITVYNFYPTTTGEFLLRFAYSRPWEKRDPQRIYEEKVVVV